MAFLMERKYFSCYRQPLLISLKWSQLGQKWANAFQSKRQRQLGDFFRIFRAILRTVAWNLMMKQMKISSLFLEIAKSFLRRQNSFAIQLPMLLIDLRYYTNFLGSATLGAKTLESQIQCHDALSWSSYTKQREISLAKEGSVWAGTSICFPSVYFLINSSVLCGFESRKGWTPNARRQAMQPAAQTSHFEEYAQFLSCYGEAQRKVPLSREKLSTLDMSNAPIMRAHPKSPIFTIPPWDSRMFSGFKSLWMTPFTPIARNPLRICLKTFMIYTGGNVFFYACRWLRSPRGQYSMMICISSFSSSRWQSQTFNRFGWENCFMSSISCMAYQIWKGLTLIFFKAKGQADSLWARQTQPKEPQPIIWVALQDCIGWKDRQI